MLAFNASEDAGYAISERLYVGALCRVDSYPATVITMLEQVSRVEL